MSFGDSGGAGSIQTDSDVALNNPQAGQVLAYNASAKWVNAAQSGNTPGEVLLDSFDGADDDAKLAAAMSYCAAQTFVPSIRLGIREYTFTQTISNPYDGFKLLGCGQGAQPKIGGSATATGFGYSTRVKLAVPKPSGKPAGVWINATAHLNDMTIEGILFYSPYASVATQMISANYANGGGLWGCTIRDCTFQSLYSVCGNSTEPCAITLCLFEGFINVLTTYDTAFHLGGSDNRGIFVGMTNIYLSDDYTSPAGNMRYCIILDNLIKTHVGSMYITATSTWRGLLVKGPDNDNTSGLIITAPIIEGDTAGANPGDCDGALMRIEGGGVTLRDAVIDSGLGNPAASASANPSGIADRALVEVTAGQAIFDGCWWGHYGPVPNTTPVIWASGSAEVQVKNSGRYVYAGGTAWDGQKPIIHQDTAGLVSTDDTMDLVTG